MVKEHAFFLAEIKFDQIRVALGHKYRTNNGFHRAFSQLRKKQAGANNADLRADFCSGRLDVPDGKILGGGGGGG